MSTDRRDSDRRYDTSAKRRDDPDYKFRNSRDWRDRLRPQQLQREPLCRHCALRNLIVPATEVDHIKEPRGDFKLQRDPANFQSLCASCHGVKTRGVELKGCTVDGAPINPNHHWNT